MIAPARLVRSSLGLLSNDVRFGGGVSSKKYYGEITPQGRENPVTVIEFINSEHYVVQGLRSFTLYAFSVATTTRFGSSKPITCQEYTEPCTVPQSLSLVAVSSETATFAWKAPRKNNGPENSATEAVSTNLPDTLMTPLMLQFSTDSSYLILFSQEPAPQFHFWQRYRCGSAKRFTITDLSPNIRYLH
ncbi:unnamed protein product [Gongylonema pulchrum]|uniref:Fibronectin type-III domain-containing protein n=1 Tax=Gongylonema pulchrum TaxID=637853 RepID=A0A183CW77_9BILA|nr:unnamed protein product [Gongylonema pulchrum]